MPVITDLPCEIVGAILKNLDHLRFLPPALLACRHFYASFKETHGVEASILRRQIHPALIPFAVSVAEASRLPRPLVASSVISLLDEPYSQPAKLAASVSTLPTSLVRKMGRTHDVIHALTTDYANSAWQGISPGTGAIDLSPSEYFRFCHAFYRIELVYTLQHHAPPAETHPWLFSKHAPWENEQLGCAYEYLETSFAKASFDVVAHDVDFGQARVDYIRFGDNNDFRQTWISQGVEFVYKLTLADSYGAKRAMLLSPINPDQDPATLPPPLLYQARAPEPNNGLLADQLSDAELRSMLRSDRPHDDSDRGPYEAWRYGQMNHALRPGSIMASDTFWLRERAYVLWDGERMKKQTGEFGESPQDPTLFGYGIRDYDEMYDSFRDRTKIWREGGTGYWSKGDTSRIVWRE